MKYIWMKACLTSQYIFSIFFIFLILGVQMRYRQHVVTYIAFRSRKCTIAVLHKIYWKHFCISQQRQNFWNCYQTIEFWNPLANSRAASRKLCLKVIQNFMVPFGLHSVRSWSLLGSVVVWHPKMVKSSQKNFKIEATCARYSKQYTIYITTK